ncbi:tetratricopeptide repeat protein [Kordiimonas lacus]|uniref:Sel1 repeat-containing protein n=1 Tax=Kordiimonas lacus TaxID=637679 RepID=A0A1G6YHD0_9PROT|nr:SEL1-like repeat protein [Kordiimonas lacus]SDD89732.1 Sel1 repeat-containing protein [Kordiimonas lacus]
MTTSIFCRFTAISLFLLLPGCVGNSFFCKAEHEDPKVASLMRDSCQGNRGASMQLGLWFEGEEDYERAARYYRAAATPDIGQTYIYVPPAGDVGGYVMPIDTGPHTPGNAEAQYRLGLMYRDGRGVKQSASKARSYFRQAAEQGHADAKAILAVTG